VNRKPYEIVEFGGAFTAYDENGNLIKSFEARDEAEHAVELRKDAVRQSQPENTPPPQRSPRPSRARRPPAPSPASPAPGPSSGDHADAFSVVSFGKDAGFGTFDRSGQLDPKHFADRTTAQAYADAARARHQQQIDALKAVAARKPYQVRPSPFFPPAPRRPASSPIDLADLPSVTPAVQPSPSQGSGSAAQAASALGGIAQAASALAGVVAAFRNAVTSSGRTSNPARAPVSTAIPGGYPAGPASQAFNPFAHISSFARNWRQNLGSGSFPFPWSGGSTGSASYSVGQPGSQASSGFARAVKSAIGDQFSNIKQSVSGAYSATGLNGGWPGFQAVFSGFVANFRRAYQNPAGGIPFGAGGQAGAMASQVVGAAGAGYSAVAKAASLIATRVGSGVTAAIQARASGASGLGAARAFAGGVGGLAGGALGAALGGGSLVVGVATAFADLVVKMRAFAEGVVESNRGLSRYNGAIASGYIGLAVHDFHREIRMGRATQDTALTAVRAVDHMRDDWFAVDALQANVTNRIGGFAAAFSGGIGAGLAGPANGVGGWLDRVDPKGMVSAGTGAGLAAGLMALPKSLYNSFVNDPLGSIWNPGGAFAAAFAAGSAAAANAAAVKVAQVAAGATDKNLGGVMIHQWAAAGPMLPRRTPRP
jgi:hypothetical protein